MTDTTRPHGPDCCEVTTPASVHVPPARRDDAEHQTVTLDLLNDPGRAFVLSEDALADLGGKRVPLTDGADNRLGHAVVTGAEQTDAGLRLTMAVRVDPGAPAGYLDALRRDAACEFSAVSWGPDRRGEVRHVTLRRAWPGPGLPARPAHDRLAARLADPDEPDPFHRVTVACTSCSRMVADACQDEIESGLCLRCLNGPILPDEAQREEARALFAEHGPADPAVAPDADVLWLFNDTATTETRAWLLERIGGGARCFVENHDRAIQHWRREAARAARDADRERTRAARYKARLATAREEVAEYDGILTRQGDLLTGTVNALKGPPPPLTTWSHHDVPEVAAEVVAERDRLRAEVHALERPHLCVASGMPVGRCRDTDLCDCFGGQTVMQRLMAAEGDAMALAERVRVLAETWDTKGAGITSWTRAAADLRAALPEAGR